MFEFVGFIILILYSWEKKVWLDVVGDVEVFGFKELIDLFLYFWGGVVVECV